MAAQRDYYQVLGVAETATTDEIKKAFRRLAKQYHPDRNPNNAQASDRFKEINEAHDVLSDTATPRSGRSTISCAATARSPETTRAPGRLEADSAAISISPT